MVLSIAPLTIPSRLLLKQLLFHFLVQFVFYSTSKACPIHLLKENIGRGFVVLVCGSRVYKVLDACCAAMTQGG